MDDSTLNGRGGGQPAPASGLPQRVFFEDSSENSSDWRWPFWPLVPLYPYGNRRTLRTEIVKDTVWTFDQVQGIFYVVVPIRMTVVRLAAGGLLVYAPIAPTRECVRLLRELEAQHGAVQYIILPTVSGLEHKVFVGPFARQFRTAQVFVAPHQWSFPLNLPLSWLGLPLGRTQPLPEQPQDAPFADEFDYAVLGPIHLGVGPFEEVAFFHRRSHSLLLTDSIVSIPAEPPPVVQLDPFPLLFHARDRASEVPEDKPVNRLKGWQRIVLFAFYFSPGALEVPPWGNVFAEARQVGDRSRRNYFGLYPFRWKPGWEQSFEALRQDGRLLVAPILQKLILNRAPQQTLDWAARVAGWDFHRILPCHLDAPLLADSRQFRRAFTFLEKPLPTAGTPSAALPEADLELLNRLDHGFSRRGILPAAKELV